MREYQLMALFLKVWLFVMIVLVADLIASIVHGLAGFIIDMAIVLPAFNHFWGRL